MLNDKVLTALQIQMNNEYNNCRMYKAFSGIADYMSLLGACSWFQTQSLEEYGHFDKFYSYISDKGHIPHLSVLPEIPPQIMTLDQLFVQTVALENQTLEHLKTLAEICKEMKDDQSYELVLWYLKEQVEECKSCEDILKRVIMSMNNILIIDQELAAR
jgi:ferritin